MHFGGGSLRDGSLQRAAHWLNKPPHDDCAATSTASVPSSASVSPHDITIFFSIV
jgi:hypothetical protein